MNVLRYRITKATQSGINTDALREVRDVGQVTLRNLWFVEEEFRWSCMGQVWQIHINSN